jgi:peptidoglycan/xylan/chitin deacetylase (PgdA/CDA1 family)
LSHPRFRSVLAAAFLFAATGCSDSNDDPAAAGGTAGQTGGGGTTAAGGTAGGGGAGGTAGGSGGAAGSGGNGAGGSEQFPTPDKLVALSFDDGPSNTQTNLILDKLEAHDVPATFFLIGQNINAGTQPTLQRAAALGAEFGNHSQGYAALAPADAAAITTSVDSTNAAILEFTGTNAVFFRPPNLAVDANLYATVDMPFAGGLLGRDYPAAFGGTPTVEAVTDNILNAVQDGDIILLHDNQPELNPYPTADALDNIIPELKRRGYEILTVSELFARRGVDPNSMPDTLWARVPPAP